MFTDLPCHFRRFLLTALMVLPPSWLPVAQANDFQVSTIAHGEGAPEAIAPDGDGRVVVAANGRIYRLFEWNADPVLVAGTGVRGYAGDGGPATQARFGPVGAMVVDYDGTIYFTDTQNHRIRRVGSDGTISTWAGNGSAVASGDGGAATEAGLPSPIGLLRHPYHGLLVTSGNRIRKISDAGVIEAYAGGEEAGYGDGVGVLADARFDSPGALAESDMGGDILVADRGNNRVRKIVNDYLVVDVAGNGEPGYSGQSGGALELPLGKISGILDLGLIYLSLEDSNRVVQVNNGEMSPFAGTGAAGYSGDGGAPSQAQFSSPGVLSPFWSRANTVAILVADVGNGRVRRIGRTYNVPATPSPPVAWVGNTGAWVELVSWQEPLPLHSEYYEIRTTPGGHITRMSTMPRQWMAGLENGTSYTFALRAIFREGPGPWSPESNAVVPFAPQFPTIADATVVEGDSGTKELEFTISVPKPDPKDIFVYYVDAEWGTATGDDFSATGLYQVRIPAGETSTTYKVTINGDSTPEEDEWFTVRLHGSDGRFASARGIITNDDGPLDISFYGVPDRHVVFENDPESALDVLDNDGRRKNALVGGRLEVATAPIHGAVRVDNGGTLSDASDDVIMYRPRSDWSGEDTFSYRACDGSGSCYEEMAVVRVNFGLWPIITTAGQSGMSNAWASKPRAMAAAQFHTTVIAEPATELIVVDPDPRPSTPWEDLRPGTATRIYSLPASADGRPTRWRIAVDIGRFEYSRMRGYVGVDANGDGQPSADEVRCTATLADGGGFCDFEVIHPGQGTVRYWVLVQNPNTFVYDVDIHVAAVPLGAGDGRLVATGPVKVSAGNRAEYVVSYNDPAIIGRGAAIGFLRVTEGGNEVDVLPVLVFVDIDPLTNSGTALANGKPYSLRMHAGHAHDKLFIDVPAGASLLEVSTSSESDIAIYLSKGNSTPVYSKIGPAPWRDDAVASSDRPGGNELLTLSGADLTPGRWYVTPVNKGGEGASVSVTATVLSTGAPVIRPGAYFNAARSGHGVFLYPAGREWAALWYAYGYMGRPTWYYAQAPAPGDDGIWRAPLFNSVWTGNGNRLTKIGHITVTPTGADEFIFTHEVHGNTGSEPMASLGRGCPTLGGVPLDASSHWFDPASAGSGFSVQLWPQYEYYAAFVYDGQGVARFLAAEQPFSSRVDSVIALQQLRGTPPTSIWQGGPQRTTIGTLRRIFSGGRLSRIEVEADFVDDIPGRWASNSVVQPLGGAGTTQGCEP